MSAEYDNIVSGTARSGIGKGTLFDAIDGRHYGRKYAFIIIPARVKPF